MDFFSLLMLFRPTVSLKSHNFFISENIIMERFKYFVLVWSRFRIALCIHFLLYLILSPSRIKILWHQHMFKVKPLGVCVCVWKFTTIFWKQQMLSLVVAKPDWIKVKLLSSFWNGKSLILNGIASHKIHEVQ